MLLITASFKVLKNHHLWLRDEGSKQGRAQFYSPTPLQCRQEKLIYLDTKPFVNLSVGRGPYLRQSKRAWLKLRAPCSFLLPTHDKFVVCRGLRFGILRPIEMTHVLPCKAPTDEHKSQGWGHIRLDRVAHSASMCADQVLGQVRLS